MAAAWLDQILNGTVRDAIKYLSTLEPDWVLTDEDDEDEPPLTERALTELNLKAVEKRLLNFQEEVVYREKMIAENNPPATSHHRYRLVRAKELVTHYETVQAKYLEKLKS